MLKVTGSKINIVENEESNVKALAAIELNNMITIKNIRIVEGKNGLFVAYPAYKQKDDTYKEPVHFKDKEVKNAVSEQILKQYNLTLHQLEFHHEITARVTPIDTDNNVRGLAEIGLDGIVISGAKVVEGENGLFVSYPCMKVKDQAGNEIYDEIGTLNKNVRLQVNEKVLDEYQKSVRKKEVSKDKTADNTRKPEKSKML